MGGFLLLTRLLYYNQIKSSRDKWRLVFVEDLLAFRLFGVLSLLVLVCLSADLV